MHTCKQRKSIKAAVPTVTGPLSKRDFPSRKSSVIRLLTNNAAKTTKNDSRYEVSYVYVASRSGESGRYSNTFLKRSASVMFYFVIRLVFNPSALMNSITNIGDLIPA